MNGHALKSIVLGLLALLLALICGSIIWNIVHPAPPERRDLFTRWYGDRLQVAGSDGGWLVTHLENLTNHSIAKLPEPVMIVESGGISFTTSNLAKLKWTFPAQPFDSPLDLETTAPPATNFPIQALYIPLSRAKFVR